MTDLTGIGSLQCGIQVTFMSTQIQLVEMTVGINQHNKIPVVRGGKIKQIAILHGTGPRFEITPGQ